MIHAPNLDMSFSGLKTSVLTAVQSAPDAGDEVFRRNLARGFVDALVDVLAAKLVRAMKQTELRNVVVAGGVSANRQLRQRLTAEVRRRRGTAGRRGWAGCGGGARPGIHRFRHPEPSALGTAGPGGCAEIVVKPPSFTLSSSSVRIGEPGDCRRLSVP